MSLIRGGVGTVMQATAPGACGEGEDFAFFVPQDMDQLCFGSITLVLVQFEKKLNIHSSIRKGLAILVPHPSKN